MKKPVTSKDINDATQKRFFPDLPEKERSRISSNPPLLAMLIAPFILLYIKILDFIEWIKKNRNDKTR